MGQVSGPMDWSTDDALQSHHFVFGPSAFARPDLLKLQGVEQPLRKQHPHVVDKRACLRLRWLNHQGNSRQVWLSYAENRGCCKRHGELWA
jgi:hypothetical protein